MSVIISPGSSSQPSSGLEDYSVDRETALLIAQIQLEDALQVSQGRKGKARETVAPSDEELAFRLQTQELETWKVLVQDAALAQSLDEALQSDEEIITAHLLLEEAATADRIMALRLSRGEAPPTQTAAQKRLGDRGFNLERISER